MNIRIDSIVHKAKLFLDGEGLVMEPCTPDRPGPCHQRKLIWHVQTWCGLQVFVKGRPKHKSATCIACLAEATHG